MRRRVLPVQAGVRAAALGVSMAAALLVTAAQGQGRLALAFLQPAPGQPLFGEVEVHLGVRTGGSPVQRLDLFLDGVRVGSLTRPPWRFAIDVGDDNVPHQLEAVAVDRSGATATARLTSGTIAVQEQIEVALRPLFVRVERGGQLVPDLRREDFTVTDDGVRQQIVTFERGDVPFTAAVLLDASSSMRGGRLGAAITGVTAFARALQRMDEAKLLLFADRVLLETPFANAASFLTLGLPQVEAGGGTALHDALYLALARLEPRTGRKVVLVLSDGVDVESVLSMEDVRAFARRSDVILYWLRLGGAEPAGQVSHTAWRNVEEHMRERQLLHDTVLESGGRILDVPRIEDVHQALAAVLQELREQYVLGYYPSNQRGPDTWHEVRVSVAGENVQVRTHRGYAEP
jgi:Ca-activated chloride channel family protein